MEAKRAITDGLAFLRIAYMILVLCYLSRAANKRGDSVLSVAAMGQTVDSGAVVCVLRDVRSSALACFAFRTMNVVDYL